MLVVKYLFLPLLIIGLLVPVAGISQRHLLEMDDSTGLRSNLVVQADTVVIRFDSAYVLNKITFKLMQDKYKAAQTNNPSLKMLIENYESVITLQDTMLKSKEAYYQGLKSNFDSLVSHSNNFVDKTSLNITAIDHSLTTATNQLNNIKSLLNDSLEKLRKENSQRLKLAVGGFTVGIAAASLIFLVAK